jgi:hypothetical protein
MGQTIYLDPIKPTLLTELDNTKGILNISIQAFGFFIISTRPHTAATRPLARSDTLES